MGNRDNFRLEIDWELKEKFKHACLVRGSSMSDAVRDFIVDYNRETYHLLLQELGTQRYAFNN